MGGDWEREAAREVRLGSRVLAIVQGDITAIAADAIVNAANESLAGGGGVDGAIHRAGGPSIMTDLEQRYGRPGVRRCPTGGAVISVAGRLPARWVIHAVGPRWSGGDAGEPELLASAYRESMERAREVEARTVTFPAISCGIYGYPLSDGAGVAVEAIAAGLENPAASVQRATFVLFSGETYRAFGRAVADLRMA